MRTYILIHKLGQLNLLTHCGLIKPYGNIDLDQNWLRWWLVAWSHHTITWTNADNSSVRSCDIPLWAVSQEVHNISILDLSLKITNLRSQLHLPGVNEFIKTSVNYLLYGCLKMNLQIYKYLQTGIH